MTKTMTGTVFAIDDEPDNLELMKRTLRDTCSLQVFTSPDLALKAATESPPDLFLVDQLMPGCSGSEFLKRLRSAGVECGIVFITAYPDEGEVRALVESTQAFWIVPKPWAASNLVAQVGMALSLSKVRARTRAAAQAP
jgi:response regulator RpfG family c-di-GMP phosphodiesterase